MILGPLNVKIRCLFSFVGIQQLGTLIIAIYSENRNLLNWTFS